MLSHARFTIFAVVLTFAGFATGATAQNQLTDPDFDAGNVSTWSVSGSNAFVSFDGSVSKTGSATSGSLKLGFSAPPDGDIRDATKCFPIHTVFNADYEFGAWILGNDIGTGGYDYLYVELFQDSACAGTVFLQRESTLTRPSGRFVFTKIDLPSAGNYQGLLVHLGLETNLTQTANFDGLCFGLAHEGCEEIFTDEFETR